MIKLHAALAGTTLVLSAPAFAAPAAGLVDGDTLVIFDTDAPSGVSMMQVSGVDALVGIDFRPANETLVGVTSEGRIVIIDTAPGAATALSTMPPHRWPTFPRASISTRWPTACA